jgi:hypothetical protein
MLFKEIIAVYSDDNWKTQIQNEELLIVERGGINS